MTISDADILDIVRRLRAYMTALDNSHLVLNGLAGIEDAAIRTSVEDALPDTLAASRKISVTLKLIENSKSYRDMLKKFNIKEEDENERE